MRNFTSSIKFPPSRPRLPAALPRQSTRHVSALTPTYSTSRDGKGKGRSREEALRIDLERTVQAGLLGGGHTGGAGGGLTMRCTTLNREGQSRNPLFSIFGCLPRISLTNRRTTGNVTTTSGEFTKSSLCSRYGLQPRDLRKIDSKISNIMPEILVRKSAILVTLLHLRVVITASEVTLFDSINSEDSWLKSAFLYSLEVRRLHSSSSR